MRLFRFDLRQRRFWHILASYLVVFCYSIIAHAKNEPTTHHEQAWHKEFKLLESQIQLLNPDYPAHERLKSETFHEAALILGSDNSPLDVILRRTSALLNHLKTYGIEFASEERSLNAIKSQNHIGLNIDTQYNLFLQTAKLRRTIAFKNPLLDFNGIIFLKHNKMARGERHMIDQYLGFNQEKHGGIYMLQNAFGNEPEVSSLLANKQVVNGRLKGVELENQGSFISLDFCRKSMG